MGKIIQFRKTSNNVPEISKVTIDLARSGATAIKFEFPRATYASISRIAAATGKKTEEYIRDLAIQFAEGRGLICYSSCPIPKGHRGKRRDDLSQK